MSSGFQVPLFTNPSDIAVTVPGSKSITNRALLLAALSDKKCVLRGVLFSDDSRAMLACLERLGFRLVVEEYEKQVTIWGEGGRIPNREAVLDVRSAGTAARFLTVAAALAGGSYTFTASEQMKKRPMEPLLRILREAGAQIRYMEEEGHFPFRIRSEVLTVREVAVDTSISSQFASALLMAGVLLPEGLTVMLQGARSEGAYIGLTMRMMEQFGIPVKKEGNRCVVPPRCMFGREEYPVEPDVSAGCYFYSMAPLLGRNVLVRGIHQDSLQGDIRFTGLLEQLGCVLEDMPEGLWVRGRAIREYPGLDVDMKDFSDQTMTMAVLAPFASSETRIRNVGHIRYQESDRIAAVITELSRLGIVCESMEGGTGIRILPGFIRGGQVETYEDHRMAMSFALIGLKTGNITIGNPDCCAKTFENYFGLLEQIASEARQ